MTETRSRSFTLTLLRHGESVGNAESRWQGQTDFPLTETGRAQARALAKRWSADGTRFDLALTSTLKRARETAEILALELGFGLESDPIWMERDVGEFAGLTAAELREKRLPTEVRNPFESISGDGEGDWELFLRAGHALQGLLHRPPGNYLVVSHGGILNLAMHAVVGIAPRGNASGPRFRFGNTGFARLIYEPLQHRWSIDALNDLGHWPELLDDQPAK